MSEKIHALVIPKYGMVMTEGVLAVWHVEEGREIRPGQEVVDIETEKIVNSYESPVGGTLRRRIAHEGDTLPVGALFGVIAESDLPDEQIDAFIEGFKRNFVPPEAKDAGPSPVFINAGHSRIRYLRVGADDGVPILLVHGFGGDLYNWLLNQETLAAHRPVYALDLPGHGGSQKSVGDGAIGTLAQTVGQFLDALNLERVHLVGHSLGGAIALSTALDRPRTVQSLSLISPVGFGTDIYRGFVSALLEANKRKEMKAALEELFSDPALVGREMVMSVLEAKRIDGAVHCLRVIAQSCFPNGTQDGQLRQRLAELTLPVQVIWGEDDRIIPATQAAGLPATIAVHVLEHAGHMAHLERAKEVNELIQRFIDSNQTSGR